jgi:hypothetical protein
MTTDYVEPFCITDCRPTLSGIPRGTAPPQPCLPCTPGMRAHQPDEARPPTSAPLHSVSGTPLPNGCQDYAFSRTGRAALLYYACCGVHCAAFCRAGPKDMAFCGAAQKTRPFTAQRKRHGLLRRSAKDVVAVPWTLAQVAGFFLQRYSTSSSSLRKSSGRLPQRGRKRSSSTLAPSRTLRWGF